MYYYSYQLHKYKQIRPIAFLTSWHSSIFGYKNRLRKTEAENP